MLLLRRGGSPSSAGTSNSAYPPHLSDPVKAGDGDHVPGRSIGRCDVSLVDQVPGRNLTLYRLGLEIRPRCCALSWHLRSPERHRLRELLSREVVESAKKPHRVLFYPACSQDPTSKRLHFLVICLIAHRVRLSRSTGHLHSTRPWRRLTLAALTLARLTFAGPNCGMLTGAGPTGAGYYVV
jgi:hypothetical protein